MIKAVFIDYTGTITREDGAVSMEVVKRCYGNSDAKSPQEALTYWWGNLKKYEEAAYQVAMDDNDLHPAGIICGDMARAYKPHGELFEKALEVSGCKAEEVIHVGDSVASDVKGAQSAGIRPILLDRTGTKTVPGVTVIQSLAELTERLKREQAEQ